MLVKSCFDGAVELSRVVMVVSVVVLVESS